MGIYADVANVIWVELVNIPLLLTALKLLAFKDNTVVGSIETAKKNG